MPYSQVTFNAIQERHQVTFFGFPLQKMPSTMNVGALISWQLRFKISKWRDAPFDICRNQYQLAVASST